MAATLTLRKYIQNLLDHMTAFTSGTPPVYTPAQALIIQTQQQQNTINLLKALQALDDSVIGEMTSADVLIDCGTYLAPNENILIDCGTY